MLFKPFSLALLLALGVAAAPAGENFAPAVAPRQLETDADNVSTRSKWTARGLTAAENLAPAVAPRQLETDADNTSTRSKWTASARGLDVASGTGAEAKAELVARCEKKRDVDVDASPDCRSLRSGWGSVEDTA